jgi:Trypsin
MAALGACATDSLDEEAVGEYQIFGPNAVLATQSHANRSVAMLRATNPANPTPYKICTGTFIDDDHVMTAAHCKMNVGDKVAFYTTPNNYDPGRTRTIVKVGIRPGVDPVAGDFTDTAGTWSDFAIVKLNATAGAPAVIATMDWQTPSTGEIGAKVGAGGHDDDPEGPNDGNDNGTLLRIGDNVYDPSYVSGMFVTVADQVNHGDSGGSFFTAKNGAGLYLSGVLAAWRTVDGIKRAGYTNIATHLNWILDVINYTWPGSSISGYSRSGTGLAVLPFTTLAVCQYACEHTSACEAYNFTPLVASQCLLLSSVTSGAASSISSSGRK